VANDKIVVNDRLEETYKEAIKGLHGGIIEDNTHTHITDWTAKPQEKFKHRICECEPEMPTPYSVRSSLLLLLNFYDHLFSIFHVFF
jgi:hypothetical protein